MPTTWQFIVCAVVVLYFLSGSIAAPTLQNVTITVPSGSTNHGNSHLLCIPQKHTAVATFFLANYLAHVATVKSIPGQPLIPSTLDMILTLFFPGYGIIRGLSSIQARAVQGKTPLEIAQRAGALCEVVRTKYWHPKNGDKIHNVGVNREGQLNPLRKKLRDLKAPKNGASDIAITNGVEHAELTSYHQQLKSIILLNVFLPFQPLSYDAPLFEPASGWSSPSGRQVHGHCHLPSGFALSIVQGNAKVMDIQDPEPSESLYRNGIVHPNSQRSLFKSPSLPGKREVTSSQIGSFFSFTKGLVSILQLLYASYTLVQTRGDQINRYGYAAFGLTVTPYLMMSLINLLSSLVTPDYSHVYLVKSKIMKEAERHGGSFGGFIGEIEETPSPNTLSVEFIKQDVDDSNGSGGFKKPKFNLKQNDPLLIKVFPRSGNNGTTSESDNECLVSAFSWPGMNNKEKDKIGKRPETEEEPLGAIFGYLRLVFLPMRRDFWRDHFLHPREAHLHIPFRSEGSTNVRSDISQACLLLAVSTFIGMLPLTVIGGMSHFQKGESSTQAQRGWTMSWLAAGILIGPATYLVPQLHASLTDNPGGVFIHRLVVLLYAAPAIGGMVVVGQMIWDYGNCTQLY